MDGLRCVWLLRLMVLALGATNSSCGDVGGLAAVSIDALDGTPLDASLVDAAVLDQMNAYLVGRNDRWFNQPRPQCAETTAATGTLWTCQIHPSSANFAPIATWDVHPWVTAVIAGSADSTTVELVAFGHGDGATHSGSAPGIPVGHEMRYLVPASQGTMLAFASRAAAHPLYTTGDAWVAHLDAAGDVRKQQAWSPMGGVTPAFLGAQSAWASSSVLVFGSIMWKEPADSLLATASKAMLMTFDENLHTVNLASNLPPSVGRIGAAAKSGDGLVVGGSEWTKTGGRRPWIGRVDAQGAVSGVLRPLEHFRGGYMVGRMMGAVALNDGTVIVAGGWAGTSDVHLPCWWWLASISAQDTISWQRCVGTDVLTIAGSVSGVAFTGTDRIVAFGGAGVQPFVQTSYPALKVMDLDGRVIWSRIYTEFGETGFERGASNAGRVMLSVGSARPGALRDTLEFFELQPLGPQ